MFISTHRHLLAFGLIGFLVLTDSASFAAEKANTDAFGDPLPKGCIARFGTVRFRHPSWGFTSAKFLPGGNQLASFRRNDVARVWDLETGKLVRTIPEERPAWIDLVSEPSRLHAVLHTPDGQTMYDLRTGKAVWKVPASPVPRAFAFAPDGMHVAIAGIDVPNKKYTLEVYDFTTGNRIRQFPSFKTSVVGLVFSPDGKHLACRESVGLMRIFDEASGQVVAQLDLDDEGAQSTCLAFSPQGDRLATTVGRKTLLLWDWKANKVQRSATKRDFYLPADLVFTPDGKRLFLRRHAGYASEWKVDPLEVIRDYDLPPFAPTRGVLALSPDGKLAVSYYGASLHLWDIDTGRDVTPVVRDAPYSLRAKWSSDGKKVALQDHFDHIHICDPTSGRVLRKLTTPDGQLATWHKHQLVTLKSRRITTFWDDRTGKKTKELDNSRLSSQTKFTVSPSGKYLFASYGYFRLWDTKTGEELLLDFPGSALCTAFSPDERHLALVTSSVALEIRELPSGKVVERFDRKHPPHFERISNVVFSPDGKRLAISCQEPEGDRKQPRHIIRLLDWKTKHVHHPLPEKTIKSQWNAIAFSPDGKLLAGATYDEKIQRIFMWDLEKEQPLPPLEGVAGFGGTVTQLEFSPDGKHLLSVGSHGNTLIWDVKKMVVAVEPR